MKRILFCWFFVALAVWPFPLPAQAQPLSDEALARIDFLPNLGAQVSLDLPFQDEQGREVRLADYFGSKPVILVLGYYGCPMLCTLVLNGLIEGLQDMKWKLGSEFVVLNVSINPEEGPRLALSKKRAYVRRYGRAGGEAGWHFLTGKEPSIRSLTRGVGFGYQFDPASRQYAHPSGLIILTPQGRVSSYLYGVAFTSTDLQRALQKAGAAQIASPIKRILLLCFHYNPLQGKYSASILFIIRLLSVCTFFGLAALILSSTRRPKPS